MQLELLKGSFSRIEALELLTRMIEVKIQFHESKIERSHQEEDIKMRENRIKELQRDFFEVKRQILENPETCTLNAVVKIG
jgi:hypothetical protein